MTEHDPDRPWIVLGSKRETVTFADGVSAFSWARDRGPRPRWSIELNLWQLGPTHLRTGDAPTRFKQPRLTHGSSGGVAVGGLATAARLLAPAVGDLRLPDLDQPSSGPRGADWSVSRRGAA